MDHLQLNPQPAASAPRATAWHLTWSALAVAVADPALLPALIDSYSQPHRKYHTLQHLDACLANFQSVRDQALHPAEVELALWFHDAVYEINAQDNERRSADWAASALLAAGADTAVVQRVEALVMATNHKVAPQTPDEALLLDVDLAILGAAPDQFDRYEAQVQAEYASIDGRAFRRRRRGILQQFLDRAQIYRTAHFQSALEQPARANLRRSIGQLSD